MRSPAVAGRFYPDDREGLIETIEFCFRHPLGPGMPGETGSSRRILAAMAPHAGYLASGMNAAHTFGHIKEDGLPDVYVIVGPDHYGLSPGITVCPEAYGTPLGECTVDDEVCSELLKEPWIRPSSHPMEHSVEVEVPFIQYIDPDPRIVPIVMGDQSPASAARLAGAIRRACDGRDAIVIASTDMSHYVPKQVAQRLDSEVLDNVSRMDVEGMYRTVLGRRVSMCGYGPTAVAMAFAEGAHAEHILHTDSYDSLGMDPGSVVGYGSAVFTL